MRLSRLFPDDTGHVLRCTAQAGNMMRQARGFHSMLLRVQALRQKREADGAATNTAAWTEHCLIGMMAEALGRSAPPPPASVPEAEEAAAEPQPDVAAEADRYAIIHPRRAAAIRKNGRVTAECGRDPIPAELVQAIITGTSPTLRQFDKPAAATA